jgi:hypothetical protein
MYTLFDTYDAQQLAEQQHIACFHADLLVLCYLTLLYCHVHTS